MPSGTPDRERTIGLFGATNIGVAAIIGGGILALAGGAFLSAGGGGAILAIALNGVIALLTAMSFAELATAFPRSGGAYVFANRVLSIRAAFAVGWVLWFAYIVACVLYALGFAAFALLMLSEAFAGLGLSTPAWVSSHAAMVSLATAASAYYTLDLTRHASGGGSWLSVAKVAIFGILIIAGAVVMLLGHPSEYLNSLTPFVVGGSPGVLHAMGLTFVLLHGFEVIAAVGGEVKDPRRVIPRAMFISVGLSLAVYVPLLFFTATVGVPEGTSLAEFSARHGDTVVAAAVRHYLGPIGYWLVIAVAVLAFLSALRANIMAGSRIALSMARDHALPSVLARMHAERQTPSTSVFATGGGVLLVLFVLPNLEAAGAAASLIFLLSFALTHLTAYLARKRAEPDAKIYRSPWFPLVPIGGGLACLGLGAFEALAVPAAGRITLMWLAFGVILYFALFRTQAEIADAAVEGLDPSLGRLRGKEPLVVVPIASPANAGALVEVANALAPSDFARVLLLSVIAPGESERTPQARLADAQRAVTEALSTSLASGSRPDALISVSDDAWSQIRRVARFHECESLLLGLGQVPSGKNTLSPELEQLIDDVDCDVGILRAPNGWELASANRILVPVGGRGEEHRLRARILGSLCRAGQRDVRFITVLPTDATDAECEAAEQRVRRMATSQTSSSATVDVVRDDDPIAAIELAAVTSDLVVLGLRNDGGRRKVVSRVALAIASDAPCATLLLSSKRSLGYRNLYDPIRGVMDAIGPTQSSTPKQREAS
ncbi:MAG: amino acid permease [Polyangiaceae bacterium]